MKYFIAIAIATLAALDASAGTDSPQNLRFDPAGFQQKIVIDFTKNKDFLFDPANKGMAEALRRIAMDFAERHLSIKEKAKYDGLVSVLNPVLENAKFQYYFRFNLLLTSGGKVNCHAITAERFDTYSAMCYHVLPADTSFTFKKVRQSP